MNYEFNLFDDEDDKSPYPSIARPGAQLNEEEPDAVDLPQSSAPAVQPQVAPDAMADYNKQSQVARAIRDRLSSQNADANMGRALAQLASAGSSVPVDDSLYDSIIKQNDARAAAEEKDLGTRASVMRYMQQAKMRQAGLDQQKKIAEDRLNFQKDSDAKHLKATNDRTQAIRDAAGSRLDNSNIRTANSIIKDTNVAKEVNKLNASRSVQTLVDHIKDGSITDSKGIRTQLTNLIATIEMGGPGAHADRAAMGFDTIYTRVKDALNFLDSSPGKTIPQEYLAQLEQEGQALGDRAAKNYHALLESKLSGADLSNNNPDVDPGKVYKLVKQQKEKFLSENGYDPVSGNPIRERHSGGPLSEEKKKRLQELRQKKAASMRAGQ